MKIFKLLIINLYLSPLALHATSLETGSIVTYKAISIVPLEHGLVAVKSPFVQLNDQTARLGTHLKPCSKYNLHDIYYSLGLVSPHRSTTTTLKDEQIKLEAPKTNDLDLSVFTCRKAEDCIGSEVYETLICSESPIAPPKDPKPYRGDQTQFIDKHNSVVTIINPMEISTAYEGKALGLFLYDSFKPTSEQYDLFNSICQLYGYKSYSAPLVGSGFKEHFSYWDRRYRYHDTLTPLPDAAAKVIEDDDSISMIYARQTRDGFSFTNSWKNAISEINCINIKKPTPNGTNRYFDLH